MIPADPDQRQSHYSAVVGILGRRAGKEERELLRSFASVICFEAPDRFALTLPAEALAERIYRQFRFVTATIPPATQLYKGLPGIHVSVRNPGEDEAAEEEVQAALASVGNLIRSCLRTNFYQRPERPVISIKVNSRKVEGMPSPKPLFEIYVHSRMLEGIHLRGGKVARGGIRWSDRPDDFRTEVLGLMKTQMVKNSIIVPVRSKGGFVLTGEIPAKPAVEGYLADRYREFISGLLDFTDNIADGTVLHPPDVVRHDEDDPYLVVAADKGTAHLSDAGNQAADCAIGSGDASRKRSSAGTGEQTGIGRGRTAGRLLKRRMRDEK